MTALVTYSSHTPVREARLASWLSMLDRGNGHPVALRLGRVVIVGYLDCDGDPGAALDAAARGGTGDLIQLRQVCMASSFGQRATLGDGDIRLGGIDAYYTEAAAA